MQNEQGGDTHREPEKTDRTGGSISNPNFISNIQQNTARSAIPQKQIYAMVQRVTKQ
jgi:hypothetical protein